MGIACFFWIIFIHPNMFKKGRIDYYALSRSA